MTHIEKTLFPKKISWICIRTWIIIIWRLTAAPRRPGHTQDYFPGVNVIINFIFCVRVCGYTHAVFAMGHIHMYAWAAHIRMCIIQISSLNIICLCVRVFIGGRVCGTQFTCFIIMTGMRHMLSHMFTVEVFMPAVVVGT